MNKTGEQQNSIQESKHADRSSLNLRVPAAATGRMGAREDMDFDRSREWLMELPLPSL
jgi:hypothetical protein